MEHELDYTHRPREMRQRRCRGHGGRARERRVAVDANDPKVKKLIERGLNGDRCGGALAGMVASAAARIHTSQHRFFRRLLCALDAQRSTILASDETVRAIAYLAGFRDRWIRRPEDWVAPGMASGRAQLGSFLRHMLCRYSVPTPFDWAWINDGGVALYEAARGWMVHVGGGENLRTAQGLPFPLTRAMSHAVMRAPADLTLPQALRWGQFVGMGVREPIARAAASHRLANPLEDESFSVAIGHFLAANPQMQPGRVGPITDYLVARRFGSAVAPADPNFTPVGRTPEALRREMRAWHEELNRRQRAAIASWPSCGIPGFAQAIFDGDTALQWKVIELTTADELFEEGREMHNCVASYDMNAAEGHCAIYSLRRDDGLSVVRVATMEVALPDRRLEQARGPCNQPVRNDARVLIRRWAAFAGVEVTPFSFQ
jgi:hypothetical protein